MPISPIRSFRVYPAKGSLYFLVTVFETKKDMHAYCKAGQCQSAQYPGRGFEGVVHSFSVTDYRKKKSRMRGIMGEIHLHRKRLTMEVITHESGHAALAWWRRTEGVFAEAALSRMEREEDFCYALGEIGKQIVLRTQDLLV